MQHYLNYSLNNVVFFAILTDFILKLQKPPTPDYPGVGDATQRANLRVLAKLHVLLGEFELHRLDNHRPWPVFNTANNLRPVTNARKRLSK